MRYAFFVMWILLYLAPTHALIYHSTLLVNPASGKKILLLDDAHAQYVERFGTDAEKSTHNNFYTQQKKQLDLLGKRLLNLDREKGSRIVVLTEAPTNSFGRMVEQEVGAAPIKDNQEALEILPRIFLQSLTANLQTMDEKLSCVRDFKSFNGIQGSFGYTLRNGLFWLLGDRRRTELDAYLGLAVYEKWQQIVQDLDERASLRWKIKNCFGYCAVEKFAENERIPGTEIVPTIDYVVRYIDALHAEFKKHGLDDSYYQRISQFLKDELAAGHIVATDHIARLYAYLARNNRLGSLNGFNQDMLAFVSLKCDVEFREYSEAFDRDAARKYMIVVAGGVHNIDIKKFLLSKGYVNVLLSTKYVNILLQSRGYVNALLLSKGYVVDKERGKVIDPDLADIRVMFSEIFDGACEKPLDLIDDIGF